MKIIALVVGLLMAITARAWTADHSPGYVAHVGKLHVELFIDGRQVALYFWDRADRPIEGRLVVASADIVSGQHRAIIGFVPIGESLRGHAPFGIAPDAKVLVTFSVSDGGDQRADFSLDERVPGPAR